MCQRNISVWFMCKLCRGSFRQVDDFIEHKKEEHFTEFQQINCIVFEETEYELLGPATIIAENRLTDENIEPPIKIEANDEDPIIPFSSEINDEPNFDLVEPKNELITFESEINPESENNFFGLKQPEQNPYVLLKRLTSDEIHRACIPKQRSRLLKCEQKNFVNDSEFPNSSDGDSNMIDPLEGRKSAEVQPTTTVINISEELKLEVQFKCKLCSKQLESDEQLRNHVGICVLHHKDRYRYCVTCNQKFTQRWTLERHNKCIHGTEEDRLTLYKFKCQLCPNQYRRAGDLWSHLESHGRTKKQSKIPRLPRKSYKCSQPNCAKEFKRNSELKRHTAAHFGLRPYSCSFPKCNKKFTQSGHLKAHLRTHTGERPYKCTLDNCNKTFTTSYQRSTHYDIAHRDTLLERHHFI